MSKNVIIIGAGPGGYVCAIRSAQLGNTVTVIDQLERPGGTCLNMGCIPSKNLLHATYEYHKLINDFPKLGIEVNNPKIDLKKLQSQKRQVVQELAQGVKFLFKKNNISFINAAATLIGSNQVKAGDEILSADAIVIATGSIPRAIPGITVDEKVILSSTGLLELERLPKSLAIIGGGYIGLELGSVWQRLGSKVHVIEVLDRITPGLDPDLSNALHKILESQGFTFHLDSKISEVKIVNNNVEILLEQGDKLSVEKVLVSVGRVPNTKGISGIEFTNQGFIKVDQNLETSIKGVYAIGDVVEGAMLAHKAEEEGMAVAEHLSGMPTHIDYNVIPAVVYTQPEVACVGFTEPQLIEANIPYKASKFPFSANSRAKVVHETVGFVKLLSHEQTGLVLGAHIIGSCAGTMIAQVAQAMQLRATVEDIARTCHAHPTHNEAIKEAAWAGVSRAIHL